MKDFCRRKLGITTTTNGMRSIIEMTANRLYQEKKIDDTVRASISSISGHSSKIVKDYYLLQDRQADLAAAGGFNDAICKASGSPISISSGIVTSPSYSSLNSKDRINYLTIKWGVHHPDVLKTKPGQRARWTKEEISYIAQYAVAHPSLPHVVASCLQHIMQDEYAHKIFHSFHTVDSARLRSGYDRYKECPQKY